MPDWRITGEHAVFQLLGLTPSNSLPSPQIGLKGEKEAVEHAKATGHQNFAEY